MSTILITIALLSLIVRFNTVKSSQSLTCHRDVSRFCGPCTNTRNTACNLNCNTAEDACVEISLQCQNGIPCYIQCNSLYACMGARVDASSSTALTMECGPKATACESTQITAGIYTKSITINCNGYENSCKELILNANSAALANIIINCDGWNSCTGLVVNAANARDVTINCNNNQGRVCERVRLNCGKGDCKINCRGVSFNGTPKCNQLRVTTGSNTRSFTCVGDNYECASAPHDFGSTNIANANPLPPANNVNTNPAPAQNNPSGGNPNPIPNPSPQSNPSTGNNPSGLVGGGGGNSGSQQQQSGPTAFCKWFICEEVEEWCCYVWDSYCVQMKGLYC